MDLKILKHILNYDFYAANKHKLSPQLFEDEIRELYETVTEAHSKYEKTLDASDLLALWKVANPVAVRAKIAVMEDLTNAIANERLYVDEVAQEVLTKLWQREHGRKIAEAGIAISEGKSDAFRELQKLLEQSKDGFMPDDFGEETTQDLDELLAFTGDENRFRFNLVALNRHVYGLGRGEFGVTFARPEVGKSSFGVSLACTENGFCDQGARVFIGGNEEDTKRTVLRCFEAASGMSKEAIIKDPAAARAAFARHKGKLSVREIQDWSIYDLDAFLAKNKYDVVIVDQLDKMNLPGSNTLEGHARLGEIYLQAREIAKRHNCALMGICQASAEAENDTILHYSQMAGSKTSKAAEADLIIGIGKLPDNPDGTPERMRFLTVSKNKISGWHGTANVMLDAQTSRYTD